MSGIRVPVISQIISLAIKRGCGDMSAHVRKAAALAIPKCYRLDPNTLPQLKTYLSTLLGDSQYFVAGPAVSAFLDVCPDQLDLIHKHYRGLVKKLVDMDEWSQLAVLRLLTTYSRKCFPRKFQRKTSAVENKGFYDNESDVADDVDGEPSEEIPLLSPDLELFLRACKPLLNSRTSAVIVSVVRCYLYLGTSEYLEAAIGPLVALIRCPQDIQYIALYNIVAVALKTPQYFVKYVSHFLPHSHEPPHIWRLKLEVLTIIFPHLGLHWKGVILNDLDQFAQSGDLEIVRESVRAIGRCAQNDPRVSPHCLRILLNQISGIDENLVSEALTVIRHLIQQDPTSHKHTVMRLSKHLDTTVSPEAKSSIIWLVGEFSGIDVEDNIAPDVLRVLVKGFADETELVKQQIVLLGAKVYLQHLLRNPPETNPSPESRNGETEAHAAIAASSTGEDEKEEQHPWNESTNAEVGTDNQLPQQAETSETSEASPEEDRITLLWRYILLLARYDTSYDLRDRARLYKALLANPAATQLASLLLQAPKPVPHDPSPSETRKDFVIGTSTLVVGPDAGYHGLTGYEAIPDWVPAGQEPDQSLRDEGLMIASSEGAVTAGERLDKAMQEHKAGTPPISRNKMPLGQGRTLDEWLDDDDEEEEEEEETDSEEYEDEEEEEDGSSSGEYETDSEEESGSEEDETIDGVGREKEGLLKSQHGGP